MTISEMPRTRLEAGATPLNARSRLVMKSPGPSEGLTDKLQQSGIEPNCGLPDPLIQTLVDRLPKPNTIWSSIEDRAKWLRAAAVIFNLVYKDDGERREAAFSKQKAEPTTVA